MLSKIAFKRQQKALSLLQSQISGSFFSTTTSQKEGEAKTKAETEQSTNEVKNEKTDGRNIDADPENPAYSRFFFLKR